MKILLVGLVILRFNKLNMKPSHWWRRGKLNLSPAVTRIILPKPHLTFSWEWSARCLSFTKAETHPNIQSECLLMKAGSNYLYEPPHTKGSSQEHLDEISVYLSRHYSLKTNTPFSLWHTKAVINMAHRVSTYTAAQYSVDCHHTGEKEKWCSQCTDLSRAHAFFLSEWRVNCKKVSES